jgi:hypothetical protein
MLEPAGDVARRRRQRREMERRLVVAAAGTRAFRRTHARTCAARHDEWRMSRHVRMCVGTSVMPACDAGARVNSEYDHDFRTGTPADCASHALPLPTCHGPAAQHLRTIGACVETQRPRPLQRALSASGAAAPDEPAVPIPGCALAALSVRSQMFNEPGYEEMRGKPETEARSQQMKADIQLWTIRCSPPTPPPVGDADAVGAPVWPLATAVGHRRRTPPAAQSASELPCAVGRGSAVTPRVCVSTSGTRSPWRWAGGRVGDTAGCCTGKRRLQVACGGCNAWLQVCDDGAAARSAMRLCRRDSSALPCSEAAHSERSPGVPV